MAFQVPVKNMLEAGWKYQPGVQAPELDANSSGEQPPQQCLMISDVPQK